MVVDSEVDIVVERDKLVVKMVEESWEVGKNE